MVEIQPCLRGTPASAHVLPASVSLGDRGNICKCDFIFFRFYLEWGTVSHHQKSEELFLVTVPSYQILTFILLCCTGNQKENFYWLLWIAKPILPSDTLITPLCLCLQVNDIWGLTRQCVRWGSVSKVITWYIDLPYCLNCQQNRWTPWSLHRWLISPSSHLCFAAPLLPGQLAAAIHHHSGFGTFRGNVYPSYQTSVFCQNIQYMIWLVIESVLYLLCKITGNICSHVSSKLVSRHIVT